MIPGAQASACLHLRSSRLKPALPGLLLVLAACAVGSESSPYDAWANGRPAEAAPLIQAAAGDDWRAWHDAGLAWAAAEDRGKAAAALLTAHRLAPAASEPLRGLESLGAALPDRWLAWLGPIALPANGWWAVPLLAVAALLLGWSIAGRGRSRLPALGGSLALGVLLGPGLVARWHDGHTPFAAIAADTRLHDAGGAPGAVLPAGTVVIIEPGEPWAGRRLVRLADGGRGFVPEGDLIR